jgi:HSP20 family protein
MLGEPAEGMFSQLNALREEMDNLFTSMTRSFGFPEIKVPTMEWPSQPEIVDVRFEVSESDHALEVKAEMPGLTEDDIKVQLANGMLTIKGEKRDDREEKKKDYHVRECRYGSFSRSFRVPESVIVDDITADLEKGVLRVILPKRSVAKRRPKSVKVSGKR